MQLPTFFLAWFWVGLECQMSRMGNPIRSRLRLTTFDAGSQCPKACLAFPNQLGLTPQPCEPRSSQHRVARWSFPQHAKSGGCGQSGRDRRRRRRPALAQPVHSRTTAPELGWKPTIPTFSTRWDADADTTDSSPKVRYPRCRWPPAPLQAASSLAAHAQITCGSWYVFALPIRLPRLNLVVQFQGRHAYVRRDSGANSP